MLISYVCLAVSICLSAIGQILLKSGAMRSNDGFLFFLQPRLIAGFFVYVCAGLLYTTSIKKLPLSVASPSVAASYALVALAGHFIWHEPFSWRQWIALGAIAGGIILLNQR